MTHADLLLLASVYAKADVLVLSHSDARSLVSAFDRLLEERDALRRERDEVRAALPYGWEVDLAERRTQERDAALQRASSAESELVRMSERMEALATEWGAKANQPRHYSYPEADAADGAEADTYERCSDALRSLVNESAPTNDKEKTR